MSASLPLPLGLAAPRLKPWLPAIALTLAALVTGGSAIAWIARHPEVAGWDQIGYADELARDLVALKQGGWGAWRDSLFLASRHHPPGHRLLGMAVGADLTLLRLLAVASTALTAWLVFLAARLAAGRAAGWLAAAAFLVAPVTLVAAQDYMSEVLLMPALAGLLLVLAREGQASPPRWNPLWLGLCLGAGALARLSFVPQVAPALLVAAGALLLLAPARWPRALLALAVAALLAWPHWALNGGRYIGYARYALGDWHTHEISGDGPLGYPGQWLGFVADWAFGPLLAVALVLGLGAALHAAWRWRRGTLARFPWPWARPGGAPRLAVLGFALLLAGPPVAGHFLASNHNPRFLLAALPGLAVALGIGAAAARAWLMPLASGLVAGQALLLLLAGVWAAPPPLAGLRAAQARPSLDCDWRLLLPRLPQANPQLLLLGHADGFNQVQLRYAFHREGRAAEAFEFARRAPVLPQAAGMDAVLALAASVDKDVQHYRGWFRQVPGSGEVYRSVAPAAPLAALQAAGWRDAGTLAAPGPGGCVARLLLPPG